MTLSFVPALRTRLRSLICIGLLGIGSAACTITHRIEPSDKPFIVNMNINHEVKVKIEEQNADLLNLEQEVLKEQAAKQNESTVKGKGKGGK